MEVLKVRTASPYEILIKHGLLKEIPEDLGEIFDFGKVALITDSRVRDIWAESLLIYLREAGIKAELFSFPEGEASKNMDTVVSLAREMLRAGFDRKDMVLACGGGVVGDVAGFLASIYLRGIPFVQVPTTLLAQVDSSVGGKTGVDLPEGKNLLGTFYQPLRVYIDPDVLSTLPEKELKNGMAEVVKYGCILDKEFFDFLEQKGSTLYSLPQEEIVHIIYESCRLKAEVVSKDEKEGGLRRILNFGHTIGHAIEAELNYEVPHGLAVAVGMAVEARLSEKVGVGKKGVAERVIELLKKLELPFRLSHLAPSLEPEKLLPHLSKDKKVWKGKLTIVLLEDIGKAVFYKDPPRELIKEVLEELK